MPKPQRGLPVRLVMAANSAAVGTRFLSEERVPSLDGLRGIAVLLVLVGHFVQYGGPSPDPGMLSPFYKLTSYGWIGVDLFFVLSGFLITGILYDSKGSTRYFRNFYARRVLRIFPLYYGVLVAIFLLLPQVFPQSERLWQVRQDAAWYWTYTANWKIAHAGWSNFPALEHFWSLAVEEQFYLLWPIVVLWFSRPALLYTCLAALVASYLMRVGLHWTGHTLAGYVLTPARTDTLALGAAVALILRGPSGLTHLQRWSPLVLASAGAGVVAVFLRRGSDYEDFVVQTLGLSLLAWLFAALVGIAASFPKRSLAPRVFATPVLVVFGRYSYGMYVFHHILLVFKPKAISSAALVPFVGSDVLARILFAALGILMTLGIAMLSWHLYENQFLKLKWRFPYGAAPGRRGPDSGAALPKPQEAVGPKAALP
jgi:peptidoglycan/LPS O-acetylase OafA/YrhL